jgi:hypothetical protein
MSMLDSDPWFPRGTTLGVTATDQGTGIVGTQRQFVDVQPNGTVNSNAPVTCIAMRNTSSGTLAAGTVVKAKTTALLTEVDGNATVDSPIVGVVDEYLTAPVAVNDIFWLVFRGPTSATIGTGGVTQGNFVSVATGTVVASVANKTFGVALATASATALGRVLVGIGGYSSRVSTP